MRTVGRLKITLSVALLYLLSQLPKLLSPALTESVEWAIVGVKRLNKNLRSLNRSWNRKTNGHSTSP
jgi:hypothetical protein